MAILALGVSYRSAPVELLERLSFVEEDYPKAYQRLKDAEPVNEAVIVSTCNRVEVFAEVASYHAGFLALKTFLCESREVDPDELAGPLYAHYEDDAAEHLFSVASGIDSMVLGEPQILGQVRSAYRRAEREGASGPVLSALFGAAVKTGRRARTETAIESSAAAFVEAGITLARRSLGSLEGRSALVVGAGAMGGVAAKRLLDARLGVVQVASRNAERARRLAASIGGEGTGLDELPDQLVRVDVVVSSTGAPGVVLHAAAVREAMAHRSGRPMFLLDLAVPRDVDPLAREIAGVRVADIDDLRELVATPEEEVRREVVRVQGIVAEEVRRFAAARRAARVAPLIRALRERGERIRAAELAKAAPRLSSLSERERKAVEALASGIVAKLLHEPTVRLKDLSARGTEEERARMLAELFGIRFDPGR